MNHTVGFYPAEYVDYGETLESTALREAREETCLDVELIR